MPRYWMRHAQVRTAAVDGGRVTCELHEEGVPLAECTGCPGFVELRREAGSTSVRCRPTVAFRAQTRRRS